MVDSPLPPEREHLAAELALGLLDGPERAEGLRLCLTDPAFAAEVEAWSHRLSPLLDGMTMPLPSSRVWDTIAIRTAGEDAAAPFVRRLRHWRVGAVAAGAIAACLALVLIARPEAVLEPTSIGISQLASATGPETMAISYDPSRGLLRLSPNQLQNGRKSPELWVIPEDGVPRSLGMIAGQGGSLAVDAGLRPFLKKGVTLAITLEDAATAPHRAPSSPPILTGKISII